MAVRSVARSPLAELNIQPRDPIRSPNAPGLGCPAPRTTRHPRRVACAESHYLGPEHRMR
eukprot:scaffold104276_cov75-Phaeocystis_antarctica.AAC.1